MRTVRDPGMDLKIGAIAKIPKNLANTGSIREVILWLSSELCSNRRGAPRKIQIQR